MKDCIVYFLNSSAMTYEQKSALKSRHLADTINSLLINHGVVISMYAGT